MIVRTKVIIFVLYIFFLLTGCSSINKNTVIPTHTSKEMIDKTKNPTSLNSDFKLEGTVKKDDEILNENLCKKVRKLLLVLN